MPSLILPLVGMPSGPELLLIVAVIVLLFGAAKLPDLARGAGQALRIFKSETKGLLEEDEGKDRVTKEDEKTPEVK